MYSYIHVIKESVFSDIRVLFVVGDFPTTFTTTRFVEYTRIVGNPIYLIP